MSLVVLAAFMFAYSDANYGIIFPVTLKSRRMWQFLDAVYWTRFWVMKFSLDEIYLFIHLFIYLKYAPIFLIVPTYTFSTNLVFFSTLL